jgi:hypothetical protein
LKIDVHAHYVPEKCLDTLTRGGLTMKFREMLARNQAYLAPAVFNLLSTKLAEPVGFQMIYDFV